MRLFAHPDFEQAILRTSEHFRQRKLRPAIIEKDYYVTEALRVIARTSSDKVIFKGGTSLAKGWSLIERFSEDIDIFLDPRAFQPPLGKNAIDRELKTLRDAVGGHPALTFGKRKARPSVDLAAMTDFPTTRNSAGRAKFRTGSFSKQARPAAASRRLLSNCDPTWVNTSRRTSCHSAPKMKHLSFCAFCIFGEHLSRRCSQSTAKSSC